MTQLYAFVLISLLASAAIAQPINGSDIHVSDGDTIVVGGKTYRLVGFDTPETFKAKCVEERILGVRARKRLVDLINGGGLDLTEIPCACTAPQGSTWCNWGRACGTLTAKGVDVGLVLISEGLARRYICGKYKCPKRQGWCP
jgi:endonuclease YncB( thermonuclease family)